MLDMLTVLPMTQEGVELFREEVVEARKMDPADKILGGPELFDLACEFTRAGIRHQNPGIDDAAVERILRERLAFDEAQAIGLIP